MVSRYPMRKVSDKQFLWWKVEAVARNLDDKLYFVKRSLGQRNEFMLLRDLKYLEDSINDIRRILEVDGADNS